VIAAVTGSFFKHAPIAKLDKLRRAARDYCCVLCNKDKRFTVAAHNNDVEFKGSGKKAPGFMIAYVCGDPGGCHDRIDGRAGGLPKEEKRGLWDLAFKRTVAIWFRDGLLLVA
jgi:hypothetical protein